MVIPGIEERIKQLAAEREAVILVHNYQPPEIQRIADHLGDSLDLSRLAAKLPDRAIVFCGVHFMAETASILSPDKTILLPDPAAGCPMADMITAEQLRELKSEHPGAAVVMYVNSTAEVKAETDICCTSANALAVIGSIPADREIIFGPDRNLGSWIEKKSGRKMIIWKGYCPPHGKIFPEQIDELRIEHPGAVVMAHPEVAPVVAETADVVLGTGGMIRYAGESPAGTFIVGTETGMCHRLQQLFPDKKFIPASPHAICKNMKKITLEKVLASLTALSPAVTVPEEIADAARGAILRMIEIG